MILVLVILFDPFVNLAEILYKAISTSCEFGYDFSFNVAVIACFQSSVILDRLSYARAIHLRHLADDKLIEHFFSDNPFLEIPTESLVLKTYWK